jgi:hypothetical protein
MGRHLRRSPSPHRGTHPGGQRPASLELVPPREADELRADRRRPTPAQGRALELLGHAIEYLEDELLVGLDRPLPWTQGQLAAIDRLKQASRSVYFDCPAGFSLWARLRSRLARLLASGGPLGAPHPRA